ncbi:hypothetical protein, partial [Klebsiella pneumoniae]|uniref:hypothetical protein n=2 Tax=Gammaproteobacteria TaxID=1236 RepID=UPI003A7FA7E4
SGLVHPVTTVHILAGLMNLRKTTLPGGFFVFKEDTRLLFASSMKGRINSATCASLLQYSTVTMKLTYPSPHMLCTNSRKNGNNMLAHVVELKKATEPCSSGTAGAFRQRVKARRAEQGRSNQQPEKLYGVLVG